MKTNNITKHAYVPKRMTHSQRIWKQYKKNRGAVFGLIVLTIMVIVMIASQFVFDYEADVIAINSSHRLTAPCAEYPLGTDHLGRDILARLCFGAKYSIVIGICSALISLAIGSMAGAFAGFVGGRTEEIIMRIVELFLMIPSTLVTVLIVYCLGASVPNLILALGVSNIPHFARNARASVVTVRGCEYIEAAEACGSIKLRTLFVHVIPNSLSPILVQFTSRVAGAIIEAAGFSFLGLGVPAPMPEWGAMLVDARPFMIEHSYLILFPGLAIFIVSLAINLMGDGLRDALDPKLKR